jgi:hypothetical protein
MQKATTRLVLALIAGGPGRIAEGPVVQPHPALDEGAVVLAEAEVARSVLDVRCLVPKHCGALMAAGSGRTSSSRAGISMAHRQSVI